MTATNSAAATYVGATSATYVVVSSLTVSAATDKPSYTGNQTVTITALATSVGSPVANASITFTVSKPNGSVVTATATTGSNGAAVFKLRLKAKDPVGVYQARVGANLNNAMFGSAATSFTVQ